MKLVYAKNQNELFTVVNIRKTVFIIEQNVHVLEELDEKDYTAEHFLVMDKNNKYVGTARIYYEKETAIIGRVAVLLEERNKGYASFLMKELIKIIKKSSAKKVHIGAQKQALKFYESLGFKVVGPMYLDANIEHFPMEISL